MIGNTVDISILERDQHLHTMEAILTRDQRTTAHRVLDGHPVMENRGLSSRWNRESHPCNEGESSTTREETTARRTSRSARCFGRCSSSRGVRGYTSTWLRLGSLLVTLLVVSVRSAPTMSLESKRLSSPPKWVNPCGLAADNFEDDVDVVQLRDDQLLTQVFVQAKTALMHAHLFRDDFIKKTFGTNFDDLHSTWIDKDFAWLPGPKEIPKKLGEHLSKEYLDDLELDKALLNAYEFMQRYAVGLEQVVWDQEDHHLEFRKQFEDTEFKLRTVLCEIQVALVERGVSLQSDVSRSVMTSDYRRAMSESDTTRSFRDWIIFRDYMNGLEYVIEVFEHLRRRLES